MLAQLASGENKTDQVYRRTMHKSVLNYAAATATIALGILILLTIGDVSPIKLKSPDGFATDSHEREQATPVMPLGELDAVRNISESRAANYVSIRVKDGALRPLSKVEVIRFRPQRWRIPSPGDLLGVTDEDGAIRLPIEEVVDLGFSADLFATGLLRNVEPGSSHEVILARGNARRLRAIDMADAPIEGVHFFLSKRPIPNLLDSELLRPSSQGAIAGLDTETAIYRSRTTPDGKAEFCDLPLGKMFVGAAHPNYICVEPGSQWVDESSDEFEFRFAALFGIFLEIEAQEIVGATFSGTFPEEVNNSRVSALIARTRRKLQADYPKAHLCLIAPVVCNPSFSPVRIRFVTENGGVADLDRIPRPLASFKNGPEQIELAATDDSAAAEFRIEFHDSNGAALDLPYVLIPPLTSGFPRLMQRANKTYRIPATSYQIRHQPPFPIALIRESEIKATPHELSVVSINYPEPVYRCFLRPELPYPDACAELHANVMGPPLATPHRIPLTVASQGREIFLTEGVWQLALSCDGSESAPTSFSIGPGAVVDGGILLSLAP